MATTLPPRLQRRAYYEAAQKYLRSLPLEHFMEAVPHAKQREITLASLALVTARRPEVQVFNELLVQYALPESQSGLGQVVPDNMVVVHAEPIQAEGSYDLEWEPVRPLWMLEYVSKSNKRKDYKDNFRKYERDLKTPYYLLFDSDAAVLKLYSLKRRKYVALKPNAEGRLALPELDLEMKLMDGWVRYWYRGALLPLPADLQREVDQMRRKLSIATRRAERENQRAEREKQRADEQSQIAEREKQRADEQSRIAERERETRLALERELAELRAERATGRRKRENGTS
jgi:Uma2 family endonuclease